MLLLHMLIYWIKLLYNCAEYWQIIFKSLFLLFCFLCMLFILLIKNMISTLRVIVYLLVWNLVQFKGEGAPIVPPFSSHENQIFPSYKAK